MNNPYAAPQTECQRPIWTQKRLRAKGKHAWRQTKMVKQNWLGITYVGQFYCTFFAWATWYKEGLDELFELLPWLIVVAVLFSPGAIVFSWLGFLLTPMPPHKLLGNRSRYEIYD